MKKGHKNKYIIGIDEVGRGPLCGPVTLAAFCIPTNSSHLISNFPLKDSKKLSEEKRNYFFKLLKQLKNEGKINYSVSHIKHSLIDKDGLSKCIKKGIKRCLHKLENRYKLEIKPDLRAGRGQSRSQASEVSPLAGSRSDLSVARSPTLDTRPLSLNSKILLDGSLKAPDEYKNQKTIIKGDEKVKIIALASIIAKVSRDKIMRRFAKKFPQYGFEIHKGYGTKAHHKALKKYGPCEIHRMSFLRK
ncbi:MAG: Ribonuclease [Candidatus Nomurabacteria bacterium GW2011_GWB1_37_5]|uniref:Ribonuclease n=1 Tax=Candidatus Nomurabacteria bacterium GW2011_GWB1_37_5 TaxID=1618742 RepID=A0A0G0JFT3_9BACT|nr:MAG: Ribonuclease [Candidatus Nomurabacteria bacterium GW2011_GWB1_37_5]